VLPLLVVNNPDSDELHGYLFLGAVGLALYLCAGLLYIPDWTRRALRYLNSREPRRVVGDEPGVEASRPQSASQPRSIDLPHDAPEHAPAVPDDAAVDPVRHAPGHSAAE
jgi:hypothetical protein